MLVVGKLNFDSLLHSQHIGNTQQIKSVRAGDLYVNPFMLLQPSFIWSSRFSSVDSWRKTSRFVSLLYTLTHTHTHNSMRL